MKAAEGHVGQMGIGAGGGKDRAVGSLGAQSTRTAPQKKPDALGTGLEVGVYRVNK